MHTDVLWIYKALVDHQMPNQGTPNCYANQQPYEIKTSHEP